ncbi:MAG: tRNA lysidine(34) synthetase TilS [Candidatus Gracilibacteria bacterium]
MNQQELKKLETKLLKNFQEFLPKKSTVILGVSGGPDSVFLLYLLDKLTKSHSLKIIVAHVNHLLRGIESDLDEKFVKDLTESNNHLFYLLKKDVKKLSKTLKKGLEETGREIRYQFFHELAKKHKANFIITAHQADDNLETIIMNFARGAGFKGLAGMKEIEQLTTKLQLLRPLLDTSKDQILEYLKTNKIPFRTDKSNKDIIYKRNYIRHKIIPSLKKINPNIADTVAKNTKNFRETLTLLETQSLNWINKNLINKSPSKINAKTLRKQPKTLQKEIILQLYKNFIGNTKNIETPHVEEVLKIINSGVGNKKKNLGKLIFSIKNNILSIKKSA